MTDKLTVLGVELARTGTDLTYRGQLEVGHMRVYFGVWPTVGKETASWTFDIDPYTRHHTAGESTSPEKACVAVARAIGFALRKIRHTAQMTSSAIRGVLDIVPNELPEHVVIFGTKSDGTINVEPGNCYCFDEGWLSALCLTVEVDQLEDKFSARAIFDGGGTDWVYSAPGEEPQAAVDNLQPSLVSALETHLKKIGERQDDLHALWKRADEAIRLQEAK